jgi:hypothetical protein
VSLRAAEEEAAALYRAYFADDAAYELPEDDIYLTRRVHAEL